MIFSYSQILRILTFGVFLLVDSTRPSLHMKAFSLGLLSLALMRGFGKLGLHPSAFFMWLVAHDRYWAVDRLAKQGLPHPEQCPLCDQEEETINHLLVSCVFTRKFWFSLLQTLWYPSFFPTAYRFIL